MEVEKIQTVCVVGAGTMGQGMAQSFAEAGLKVWMLGNMDKDKLDGHMAQVEANLTLFQEYGLLKEDISAIKARIHPALRKDLDEISKESDFIIESIPENLEMKKELFTQLDSCPKDVILASNTGSLTISAISADCSTPERIVGVHYFNPAHIIPLVEVHFGPKTSEETISATRELLNRVGKKPILVRKSIPGFIVNRLQAALGREIHYLIDEGVVTPEDIDTAAKAMYGFRNACIGTVEGFDMIGIDTMIAVGKGIFPKLSNSDGPPKHMYEMVERGDLGIKAGKGFYDYSGKTRAQVLDKHNRKLIKQLALFRSMEEED
jgi:3-hydroxyacyl-CoA dehydrogenase